MNADGLIGSGDVWLWLGWLYHYPGDLFLWLFIPVDTEPGFLGRIGMLFGANQDSYGGWVSGGISFFVWFVVIGYLVNLCTRAARSG